MPYGDGPAMTSLDNAFDAAELDLLMGWVLALAAFSPGCLESRSLVVVVLVVVVVVVVVVMVVAEEDWGVDVGVGAGAGAGAVLDV